MHCLDRQIFTEKERLWTHVLKGHPEKLPMEDEKALLKFRKWYEVESASKK